MEFKKLRGNRVFLELPKKEESKIIVDENTREALKKAFAAKMMKATVYAVGELVTDLIQGDVVLVDPAALERAPVIPLTKTKDVLLVSPFDIIMVW